MPSFSRLKGIMGAKLIDLKAPHSLSASCGVSHESVFECKGNKCFLFFLAEDTGLSVASRTKHTPLFLSYLHSFLGLISFSDTSDWVFSILPSLHSVLT